MGRFFFPGILSFQMLDRVRVSTGPHVPSSTMPSNVSRAPWPSCVSLADRLHHGPAHGPLLTLPH